MTVFSERNLVERYGSWVKVQVAFYDFIFLTASHLCAKCFTDASVDDWISRSLAGFADGKDFYEYSVEAIEHLFPTFEEAWEAFMQAETAEVSSGEEKSA